MDSTHESRRRGIALDSGRGGTREGREEWLMEHNGYAYIPPRDRPRATVDVRVPLPYAPTGGLASFAGCGG